MLCYIERRKDVGYMQFEYLPINDLKPYTNNAREHHAEDVTAIMNSIREFGFSDPIGVWGKDNIIVEGHGRLEAAKKLRLNEVPVIHLDHLSDEQRRAYGLAHNRTAELSEWDLDMLDLELDEIEDIDMTQFGFLDIEEPEDAQQVAEDEPPEEVESRVEPGDIWVLGDHRLICGDSTDMGVIEALTEGNKVDVLFTDPPYGMNLDTDYSSQVSSLDMLAGKNIKGGKKYAQGKVDEFHPEMITTCLSVDADEVFLWGADYFAELLPNKNDGSWIVWDKRANGNDDVDEDYSSDKMYGSCFELCWSKKRHKRDIARVKWAGVFGTEKEFDRKRWHPTQKPIALASWFLERYSKDGQSVLDLFGGSGSTLMACEQLGRKCYICEMDTHYCDVIITRWENLTGEKAVRVDAD